MKARFSWEMIIASVILAVFLCKDAEFGILFDYVDLIEGLWNSTNTGPFTLLIPVIVAWVAVLRFQNERDGGYRYILLRTTRKRYARSLVLRAAFCGIYTIGLALLIYTCYGFLLAVITDRSLTFESGGYFGNNGETIYYTWVEQGYGGLIYLLNCTMLTLYGAVWSCLGCLTVLFTRNRFVSVAFVFLLKRLSEFLLIDRITFMNPIHLRMDRYFIELYLGGLWYPPIYMTIFLAMCSFVAYWSTYREN